MQIGDLVRQDLLRIKKVIANLISNSIKYSQSGTIRIIAHQKISFEGRRFFSVKVRDEGVGIEDPTLIGQMFKRLEIKDNVNQNGIGFGLTVSKMTMEKLGGTLDIKSNSDASALLETNKGLTVEINFPDVATEAGEAI